MRWRVVVALAILGALDVSSSRAQETVPLTFIGATADGYKLSRSSRDFRDRFEVVPSKGQPVTAELTVPDLQAPGANPAPVTVLVGDQPLKNPVTIQPGGVTLTLSATLPAVATYTSTIRLTAANSKPLVIPLQIARVRLPTTVEFRDLDAVVGVTGGNVVAKFSLREMSGQKTTFYAPDLSGLALIVANKRLETTTQLDPAVSRFEAPAWKPIQPNQQLEIQPGDVQKFEIAVQAPADAGEYGGTLHVTSPDGATIDQPVTLLVRDPPFYAVLLILLGVVLSMLLRWYYQTKRPEIVRSHTALEVLKQLNFFATRPDLRDDAKHVVQALEQRVQTAYERVQLGDGDAADGTIKDVKAKLELLVQWLDAMKIVDALGSSTISPPIRKKLDGVRLVLVSLSATADEVTGAVKIVQGIPADVQQALSDDFAKARDAIVGALAKNPGGAGHSPAVQQAIADIQNLVDKANAAANSNDLNQARDLIARARQQYVRVLADEMEESIEGAAPIGYQPADWTPIADEIKRLLSTARADADPDRAWQEYHEARRVYVRSTLRGLSNEKGMLTALVNAAKAKDPNDAAAAQSEPKLASAAQSMEEARAAMDADLDAAFRSVAVADQTIREARALIDKRGVQMGLVQKFTEFFQARVVPPLAVVGSADALSPLPAPPNIRLEKLEQSSRLWEVLISVIVAGIAVLIGMKTLWFGSNTWGGYADWATAVLWGLGLHQFSFDGVNNLAQKFSSK